jgi:hypothetical protein
MARPAVRPGLILGVTLLTALASIVEAPSQLRLILLLGFLTFLPGLSLVALFPLRDMVSAVASAVGLSLALNLLVVTASMYSGTWSPTTLLVVLLAVTCVVSGAHLAGLLGLVPWPSLSMPIDAVDAEPSFEGWYQVMSGPFKGMWTQSSLWAQAELSPYPGLSPERGLSLQPGVSSQPGLTPARELSSRPGRRPLPSRSERLARAKSQTRTRIVSVTSPVSRGSKAIVVANTAPGASCHLVVYYRSGRKRVAGPGDKRADSDGGVSWTWTVGTRTARGTWTIRVICDPGGSTSATLAVR